MRKAAKVVAFMVCIGAMSVSAFADGRGFQGQLAGSQPGEHVAGVPSGGAPWAMSNSEFSIANNGNIQVQGRGLLISSGSAANTIGPVTMVDAALVCGDVVTATTGAVTLSSAGDFSIHDTLTMPAQCIAPALLIRIAATTTGPVADGAFIAVNAVMIGSKPPAGPDGGR